MRQLRWIILLVVILTGAAWLGLRYAAAPPRQVGEDNIQGMSKQELRARYGEPNWIVDENNWVYYRGREGAGTGIEFKDDVVVHYETRGAR